MSVPPVPGMATPATPALPPVPTPCRFSTFGSPLHATMTTAARVAPSNGWRCFKRILGLCSWSAPPVLQWLRFAHVLAHLRAQLEKSSDAASLRADCPLLLRDQRFENGVRPE